MTRIYVKRCIFIKIYIKNLVVVTKLIVLEFYFKLGSTYYQFRVYFYLNLEDLKYILSYLNDVYIYRCIIYYIYIYITVSPQLDNDKPVPVYPTDHSTLNAPEEIIAASTVRD